MPSAYRYDLPWDSELNFTIDSRPLPTKGPELVIYGPPRTYRCPTVDESSHEATYLMLVGPSAFGKPNGFRTFDEITDGLDNTIAVAETRPCGIHWLEPTDLDTTKMSFIVNDPTMPSISSDHPRGPSVLFCDGAVFRLSPTTDPVIVRALVTTDGGEEIDRDQLVSDGVLVRP